MAAKGSVWESAEKGTFGISFDENEPKSYPFSTQEEAIAERDRIHTKNSAIEESTSGVGKQAVGELHADVYASILHRG